MCQLKGRVFSNLKHRRRPGLALGITGRRLSTKKKGKNMSQSTLLDVLTREGVLINVSVRYWRATKKLSPEDLGLKAEDVSDRLIALGHKKLLPKEALEAL